MSDSNSNQLYLVNHPQILNLAYSLEYQHLNGLMVFVPPNLNFAVVDRETGEIQYCSETFTVHLVPCRPPHLLQFAIHLQMINFLKHSAPSLKNYT